MELQFLQLPLETCETMNDSWGFNITDRNYKSVKKTIQYMVKAAGYNANFLLNVGPMPDGTIQPEFADTLKAVGKWMDAIWTNYLWNKRQCNSAKGLGNDDHKKQNGLYAHSQ